MMKLPSFGAKQEDATLVEMMDWANSKRDKCASKISQIIGLQTPFRGRPEAQRLAHSYALIAFSITILDRAGELASDEEFVRSFPTIFSTIHSLAQNGVFRALQSQKAISGHILGSLLWCQTRTLALSHDHGGTTERMNQELSRLIQDLEINSDEGQPLTLLSLV